MPRHAVVVLPDDKRIIFAAAGNCVPIVPHPAPIEGITVDYSVPCCVSLLDDDHVPGSGEVEVEGVGELSGVALKGLCAGHERGEVCADVSPDCIHFGLFHVACALPPHSGGGAENEEQTEDCFESCLLKVHQ